MTPREIILANIHHQNPDRPGMNFSGGMNDFLWWWLGPSEKYTPKRWVEGDLELYDDDWGNIWARIKDSRVGGEIYQPVLDDWSKLDTLEMPDYDNPKRYEELRKVFSQPTDLFKICGAPGWVFNTSRYLRKMEIYFVDLIDHREEIDRLHEMVTSLLVRSIHLIGETGADGIFFCEDLGVQDALLMSPQMWRDIFKPHYKRLTAAAHEHGMVVIEHSCGYNYDLIDDLVDGGIDCFQFDQPAAYDFPALANKLKKHKVALFSPVDIQQVMPTGDRDLIEREAERMVDTFRGFLITKEYPDLPAIGVKPEWNQWAYRAILHASGIDESKG